MDTFKNTPNTSGFDYIKMDGISDDELGKQIELVNKSLPALDEKIKEASEEFAAAYTYLCYLRLERFKRFDSMVNSILAIGRSGNK